MRLLHEGSDIVVELVDSSFTDVNLTATRYSNVNLTDASFESASFAGARLYDVTCTGMKSGNANLSGVAITDSQVDTMTIDGITVAELLEPTGKSIRSERVPPPWRCGANFEGRDLGLDLRVRAHADEMLCGFRGTVLSSCAFLVVTQSPFDCAQGRLCSHALPSPCVREMGHPPVARRSATNRGHDAPSS